MKNDAEELYILVGMPIGAGGAMFLGYLFEALNMILWFKAITLTGLLYSIHVSITD